jgi:PAS domain S-box-containing protein
VESQVQSLVDIVKFESQSPDTQQMLANAVPLVSHTGISGRNAGHTDLLSADGSDVTTSLSHVDAGYQHAAWLNDAKSGSIVAGPFFDPATARTVVVFAAPVKTSGVLAMFVDDSSLKQALTALGRNAPGVVATGSAPSSERLASLTASGSGRHATQRGQTTVFDVSALQRYLGSQVSAAVAASKALSDASGSHDKSTFLILLCLLVSVLGTLIVYRRVTSPIRRLEQAVNTAAQSHQPVRRLEAKGPLEIVSLSASIGSLLSGVHRDLSDGRQAESTARESEEAYRSLFEGSRIPMWVYDTETTRFLAVNAAAESLYGFREEEFLGMTLADVGIDAAVAERHLANPMSLTLDRVGPLTNWTKSGLMIEVYLTSSPLNFKGRLARFIVVEELPVASSEHPQAERSLRLESIGERASSVAHDFNHILGIISAYTEFVKEAIRPADAAGRTDDSINWINLSADVGTIERAVHRGAELTDRLLAFVRQEEPSPQLLDVEDLIDDVACLIGRSFGEDIHLTTKISPRVWPVYFDRDQLFHALFNLAVNARDAMPVGGDLTFTSENVPGTLGQGDRVIIRVSDTGTGMDRETQSHVFEPFFTTKGRGAGTGLGLASVAAAITAGGGTVDLDSAPGLGTTVTIALPRCAVTTNLQRRPSDDEKEGRDEPDMSLTELVGA